MPPKRIVPEGGPPAVGPYSPGIVVNGLLFVSGQIPLNPKTGEILTGSFEEQARQTLANVKAVIESAGATIDNSVKITIYLKDMNQFATLNSIYEEYFGTSKPARATVEVSNLPKGVSIEIDAIVALE